MFNFSTRSQEAEIMDDLDMKGEELASTLRQLANVNKWLGGTEIVLNALKNLLKSHTKSQDSIKIIDIGCGGGEILRRLADWCRKSKINAVFTGIDANEFTIDYAKEHSKNYPEISYQQINIFSKEFSDLEYDIAICSLFLHHFKEDEIDSILKSINHSARIGFIINDLHRSKIAYFLFNLVTGFLGASPMIKYDGKLSIKKSFLKQDLKNFLVNLKNISYNISWKWAFRYVVVAQKTNNPII